MNTVSWSSGYSLIICEKPDAARRVAEALSDDKNEIVQVQTIPTFRVANATGKFIVCAAIGHLHGVSDVFRGREAYPVFDLEWFPVHLLDNAAKQSEKRIDVIRTLSAGAKNFVNACDFDVEGESIGYNILRYVCGNKEDDALRVKFSALTKEELVAAFAEAKPRSTMGLAKAGRARHMLDFLWGVNLSRALSDSLSKSYAGYKTISMGRVQGPTLAFVVEREVQIRTFVPSPYWVVTGVFDRKGQRFEAAYSIAKIRKEADAREVKSACEGERGIVTKITRNTFVEPPPPPFNIGDLQKEAFRVFGNTPSRTLRIAERLYLDALISYPRTGSQKIPPTIGYRQIIMRLGMMREYSDFSEDLLKKHLKPHEGEMVDSAHPAIYPTGELPGRRLDSSERKLYDLIVRRFFACFGNDAVRERIIVSIDVDGHEFGLTGRRMLKRGWVSFYKYSGIRDKEPVVLEEKDELLVMGITDEEKFESHPMRYNQGSLLEKMEKEGIGTKATRAETITTLMSRGYVAGQSLIATDLGFSVTEVMQEYSPEIISTTLTRRTESELEEVEKGVSDGDELVERVIDILYKQIREIKMHEASIGKEIRKSVFETSLAQNVLGPCPICKIGKLRMIRSVKTHKRFVGCTNYSNGCRASAPLPQRGSIKTTDKVCGHCGWPVIYVKLRRFPWRLCINPACITKGKKHGL